MRYFIELSYNGKEYHGWQTQPRENSVQETIEKALSTLIRSKIQVVGCGRTDTGVHAEKFYLHFDTEIAFDREKLKFQLNSILPNDIAIFRVWPVNAKVHARFSATSRTYEYRILEGKSPFLQDTYYQTSEFGADLEKMNEAAVLLLEYEDFKCFSKSKTDVKTYNCKIEEAYWKTDGSHWIFTIKANRFLRNMVRAIVGTLIEVGQGKRNLEEFRSVIENRDRREAGPSVKAKGLHLTGVSYPEELFKDNNV